LRSEVGKASSRVGRFEGEGEGVVVVVAAAAAAEVADPALFEAGIAAAVVVAVAEYSPNLRMVDCFPFVAAVGPGGSTLVLVRSSSAFAVASLRRKDWRASGPWWVGRAMT
jgi:hypothetical protein